MNTRCNVARALGSDHLAITTSLKCDVETVSASRKVDWTNFTKDTEEAFEKLSAPKSVFEGEAKLRKIITAAAGRHIPQGCIKAWIPFFSAEALKLQRKG